MRTLQSSKTLLEHIHGSECGSIASSPSNFHQPSVPGYSGAASIIGTVLVGVSARETCARAETTRPAGSAGSILLAGWGRIICSDQWHVRGCPPQCLLGMSCGSPVASWGGSETAFDWALAPRCGSWRYAAVLPGLRKRTNCGGGAALPSLRLQHLPLRP